MTRTSSSRSRGNRVFLTTVVFFAVPLSVANLVACSKAPPQTDDGEAIYEQYCADCHGPEGDGRGPAAYLLFPKPRNFNRADFKLRSTPMGMLPPGEDLVRTVSNGIPGTSMFAFGDLLDEEQLRAVVQHVKALTPRFAGAEPIADDQLLRVPGALAQTAELVAAGRQVYDRFGCDQCHGPEGRGDGPSAPGLRDVEGDPFPAADFTHGFFKGGGAPEDLYRTFLTGMAGTPMPSYASAIESEEQAWALVYYVLSLAPDGRAQPTRGNRGRIQAVRLDDERLLEDPFASGWDAVQAHSVYLRPLWFRPDYSPLATVRAATVGERFAFLVEWRDATQDDDTLRTQDFADAVAVQFALSEPPPFIGMGRPAPGNNVEIWYWRADRQAARDRGEPASLTSVYPHTYADRYPFATDDDGRSGPSYQGEAAVSANPAPFDTARDVGNPVSVPELARRPVHSLSAAGYGSLTSPLADRMRGDGTGGWRDGVYRVVLTSPVLPRDPSLEVDFSAGRIPIAVAIWNGAAGDRNGTKLVSQWVTLELPDEEG